MVTPLKFDKWSRLKRMIAGQHISMEKHIQFLGETAVADEPKVKAAMFEKILKCMNNLEEEDITDADQAGK